MNEEIQNIVKRFVETLNPLKIYLFGSFARGSENNESDYDFYIVMNKNYKVTNETIANAYTSLKGIKRRPVDIIINNESVFDERAEFINTLENAVNQGGILLYETSIL
ncbi:MAG: nucleotidyltransferase domain-containing protein [Treponemataceae bacterium]|nr:nucleotidyltransferase domain-containing protein [Treponemataceae bacterium]